MQFLASVCTTTNKTVNACQILVSSLMLVVGEKAFTIATILELTDVGGVPVNNCSIISSQMYNDHDDVPPWLSCIFEISFTETVS